MLSRYEARDLLERFGVDCYSPPDFQTLSSATVERVLEYAKAAKYHQPKNANGSRARYFYEYVQRRALRPYSCNGGV